MSPRAAIPAHRRVHAPRPPASADCFPPRRRAPRRPRRGRGCHAVLARLDLDAAGLQRHQLGAARRGDEPQPVDDDELLVLLRDHLLAGRELRVVTGDAATAHRTATSVHARRCRVVARPRSRALASAGALTRLVGRPRISGALVLSGASSRNRDNGPHAARGEAGVARHRPGRRFARVGGAGRTGEFEPSALAIQCGNQRETGVQAGDGLHTSSPTMHSHVARAIEPCRQLAHIESLPLRDRRDSHR